MNTASMQLLYNNTAANGVLLTWTIIKTEHIIMYTTIYFSYEETGVIHARVLNMMCAIVDMNYYAKTLLCTQP